MPRELIDDPLTPWYDAYGRERYHGGHMYLVAWDDGVVKAGFASASRRWRSFVSHGGHLLALFAFDRGTTALGWEQKTLDRMSELGPLAFAAKTDARPYLGASGGGWLECYRLTPDALTTLLTELTALREAA